jgi:GPH family glycoside/pentoside/hexuronide:cation symporter
MPSLSVRLFYGAGGAVYAVKEAAYTMFVLLFYTQVMGLNGSLTGLIIALSLVFDAITDPLVGTLSDRLRSPWGRRHPFMVLSILPLGLGFVGLFAPPQTVQASQALLAAWLLFWSLWVRGFSTTFSIPNLALATDITSDYHGRSQVLGLRLAFLFLFSVLTPAIALLWIFSTPGSEDGRFVQASYPLYGALSCVIVWVMATLSCAGTRAYARPDEHAAGMPALRDSLRILSRDLLRTLSNRSFRYLMGYDIAMMVAYGVVAAMNMLVWTYYWEFDAREVSIILSLPSLIAVALVMLSLRPLGRRFEKYQLLQLSAIGLILNCLWLCPLRMTGLLPEDQPQLIFALNFLFMLVFMYCFLMRGIQTQSIIADITDEHEWEHSARQEGGFFAASNFANKIATVAGPLYGGLALDVIGLRTGMLPGSVDDGVLDGLAVAYGLGTIPGMIIALFFGLRITLGRDRVLELQRRIRERGDTGPAPPGPESSRLNVHDL